VIREGQERLRQIVLGVDPGTAICGYGLVGETAEGQLVALTYDVITTPATLPLAERLGLIYAGITALIRRYQPDCVAVEELFFSKNARTALAVGQARGVVLLAAVHGQRPVVEYTPLQVKDAVVGYGRAEKRQIQEMVRMLLQLEQVPQPDDAADALAVAICHIHSSRLNQLIGAAP